MSTLKEWLEQNPHLERDFAQERLITEVAEEIWAAMQAAGKTNSDLAEALGKSKAFIGQALSGSRNMTLRTLADLAYSLGRRVSINLRDHNDKGKWELVSVDEGARLCTYNAVAGEVSNDSDWHTVALFQDAA